MPKKYVRKKHYLIYGLLDLRTNQIRYIGKSSCGIERAWHHYKPCRLEKDKTHKGNWIRQLLAAGTIYGAYILEECSSELLNQREIAWIAHARILGWPLTNHTDGGDGLSGHIFTEEHRQKISRANKGKKGPPLSPEHLAALMAGRKKYKHTEAHLEKLRQLGRTRQLSQETKDRLSRLISKPIVHVNSGMLFPSTKVAAESLDLWDKYISQCLKGKIASYKGHVFRYA